MKGYFKNMKTITKVDFATYLGVILAFIVVSVCQAQGLVNRSLGGMLVPICCYVCMSISLNLTVGILGAEPGPRRLHERGRLLRHHCRHEPAICCPK